MRFWKIFFFCLLVFSSFKGYGFVDSLIQILPTLIGEQRVDALNKISWNIKFSENLKAKKYAEEGLSLALANNYLEGKGLATYNLAVINSINGHYDISNIYAERCIEIYQELKDALGIAKGWNVLGVNEQNRGNYDAAFSLLSKSLTLFTTLADTVQMLKVEGNIANVNYSKGNYQKALESYINLIEYGQATKDTSMWASNLLNAGNSNSFLGNHPKALVQLFEALDLLRSLDDHYGVASTLNGIALILHRLSMYAEAEKLYLEALQIYEKDKNYRYMGISNNNLGNIYMRREDYNKSLEYYNKTLDCYQKAKVRSIGNTLINIAKVHRKTGNLEMSINVLFQAISVDSSINKTSGLALGFTSLGENYLIQKEYINAEKYLLKGYVLWNQIGQTKDLSNAAGLLSNLYEEIGDLKKALLYQTEYKETQDEVYGIGRQKEIIQILLDREKNKHLTIPQKKTKPQKDPIKYILLFGLLTGLAFWYLVKKTKLLKGSQKPNTTLTEHNTEFENLKSSLDKKNIEVAFLSLSIIQKDEFIGQFYQKIQKFTKNYPQNREAQKMLNSLHLQEVNTQDWNFFKETFEQISPNFFDNLFTQYPSLSNKELRHCALIKLSIPPKDVAQILGISMGGVHKARYRLRKQFDLIRSESLEHYLASI